MNRNLSNSYRKFFIGLSLLLTFSVTSNSVFAQEEEKEDKFSMNVTLNSDIFFGFYPFFAGSYSLNDNVDFTFYGILWSGGAAGGSWGNWTEFGVGASFAVNDALTVNPQVGLLSGGLTSGLGVPVLGEGFVPNVTIIYDDDNFQSEIYAGYYVGIDHGNPVTNNYLHYWVNGGYKINSFFSAGLHFEQLRFTGGNNQAEGSAFDFYMALGPYVQFSDPNGTAFARFSSGADLRSDEELTKSGFQQPSFFKLTLGYGF